MHLLQQLATCRDESLLEDKWASLMAVHDYLDVAQPGKMDLHRLAVLSATALGHSLQLCFKLQAGRRAAMCMSYLVGILRFSAFNLGTVLTTSTFRLPRSMTERREKAMAHAVANTGGQRC